MADPLGVIAAHRDRPATRMIHELRSPYRVVCSAGVWAAVGHGVWSALGTAPQLPVLWAVPACLLVLGGAAATAARTERALWSTAPSTAVLGLCLLASTPLQVWPGLALTVLVVAAVAGLRPRGGSGPPPHHVLVVALAAIAAVPFHAALMLWGAVSARRHG